MVRVHAFVRASGEVRHHELQGVKFQSRALLHGGRCPWSTAAFDVCVVGHRYRCGPCTRGLYHQVMDGRVDARLDRHAGGRPLRACHRLMQMVHPPSVGAFLPTLHCRQVCRSDMSGECAEPKMLDGCFSGGRCVRWGGRPSGQLRRLFNRSACHSIALGPGKVSAQQT